MRRRFLPSCSVPQPRRQCVRYTQHQRSVEGPIYPPILRGTLAKPWHRHMDNNLTVRKAKRREVDCRSSGENRVHSNLNGVSLTEDILSKREYAWLPRTEGARAPRHRLKKIYARYVLQTFSTAKTQLRHSAGNLNLIKSRLSETLLGCPWQAGGMSSASASGRAIEVARYVYDPSNSPRSAHKFGKALENLDRMVPPAAPFVALLLASA